jgi:hypothetical protein
MPREHRLRSNPGIFHHAGPQVLDQDVGVFHQAMNGRNALRRFDVQRDGALAAVLAVEMPASGPANAWPISITFRPFSGVILGSLPRVDYGRDRIKAGGVSPPCKRLLIKQ